MSKNYFKGIMRSMREFTAEMDSNKARYDRARAKAAEDYAEAKGSMLYNRVFSEVDNDFSTRRGATVEKYKKELISLLDGMRAEASTRVIKVLLSSISFPAWKLCLISLKRPKRVCPKTRQKRLPSPFCMSVPNSTEMSMMNFRETELCLI